MSLIVIAGVLVTGLLSVGAYRLWLKATADDDDVEIDGTMRTRIRHGGL
ncbi:unnamed protein product [Ectocarpus sp. 4 AP-2014]